MHLYILGQNEQQTFKQLYIIFGGGEYYSTFSSMNLVVVVYQGVYHPK